MRQGNEKGRRGGGGPVPRRGHLRSPPARPLGGGERNRPAVHRPRPQDPGEGARADPPRPAQVHGGLVPQGPVARGRGDGQLLRGMPPRAHAAVPGRAHEQAAPDAPGRAPHGAGIRAHCAGVRRGQRADGVREVLLDRAPVPEADTRGRRGKGAQDAPRQGYGVHLARGHGCRQGTIRARRPRGDGPPDAAAGWRVRGRRHHGVVHATGVDAAVQVPGTRFHPVPSGCHAAAAQVGSAQAGRPGDGRGGRRRGRGGGRRRGHRRGGQTHLHPNVRAGGEGYRVQHALLLRRRAQGWIPAVPPARGGDHGAAPRFLLPRGRAQGCRGVAPGHPPRG
mmetsp:Transcript_2920/g.11962  ORF Transcript_2920/g.11962 Transcript_2920/m.11962 type:complete len:336 (-) Transcript_2920:1207-2214(-)